MSVILQVLNAVFLWLLGVVSALLFFVAQATPPADLWQLLLGSGGLLVGLILAIRWLVAERKEKDATIKALQQEAIQIRDEIVKERDERIAELEKLVNKLATPKE